MYIDDTIAAIATPPGIGGVGIIRVSGKDSFPIVNSLFKSAGTVPLMDRQNRTIQYGTIVDPATNKTIDEVLVLLMKGPHSYTAEDVVEIQCHGGIVPVRQILKLLVNHNVRMAEAGEFTKRAFMNGRIDLTQAEAIIDIIEAKTEDSLSLAVAQLDGTVSSFVKDVREQLIAMIAHLEVTIDYPEEDIEDVTSQEVREQLEPILKAMDDLLSTANTGRLIRDGITTVIVGRPNAGKSSLMNALLRENRAIVTDIPGTTRDSIEEYLDIRGIPLRIVDTAGLRRSEDRIEQLGIQRTREFLASAALVLFLLDASQPLTPEDVEIFQSLPPVPVIIVVNKIDLPQLMDSAEWQRLAGEYTVVTLSAKDRTGFEELEQAIERLVLAGAATNTEMVFLSNTRHFESLDSAGAHLRSARQALQDGLPLDCATIDLRSALAALGQITGETVSDEVVREIFAKFCLGK